MASVGKERSEKAVSNYVKNQGKQDEYIQLMLEF